MKKSEKIILIVLFIIALLPLVDLFKPGLPITHDGQDHVARIANFYESLTEGNIVPRWARNLNWGYGHPILMFLYPLPSYIASLFKAIGFSFVDATKLVFATSFIASIFAMYLWTRSKWGIAAGFVAAVLYGFAPYRFVDLYVRGAIGEHVAFIFPPLILFGLERRSLLLISLATAGLILSHNAVSLLFLPIIGLYILYLKRDIRFLFFALFSLLLGFAVSAFFWVPAFFEGKYTLRDIVTKGEFSDRFVPWQWFFYSPWNYGGGTQFTKHLGFAQWSAVLIALVFLRKKQNRLLIGGLLLLLLISLFLMTRESKFVWNTITILQKFQFPWRLLSLTTFLSATFGALVVAKLPKRYVWMGIWILSLVALISTNTMWHAKDYQIKLESFYSNVYAGTTDTGESSPIWSVRFMEQVAPSHMEVIEGGVIIHEGQRRTTEHEYNVNASVKSRLVENTLYFPGWTVLVDGKKTPIEFQDPAWRGLMTFFVEPGEHKITVVFTGTKLRQFANSISLGGIIFLSISFFLIRRNNYA